MAKAKSDWQCSNCLVIVVMQSNGMWKHANGGTRLKSCDTPVPVQRKPYIVDIPKAHCHCGLLATKILFNIHNETMGVYCARHARSALRVWDIKNKKEKSNARV